MNDDESPKINYVKEQKEEMAKIAPQEKQKADAVEEEAPRANPAQHLAVAAADKGLANMGNQNALES